VAPVAADHVAVRALPVGDEMASPPGANGTVIPAVRSDSVLAPVTPIQYVVPAVSPVIVHETVGVVLEHAVPSDDTSAKFEVAYARAVYKPALVATHVAVSDVVVAADTVGAAGTACTGVTTAPPRSSTNTAVISRGIRRRALEN
jgi:hypothetical protein